MRIAAVQVAPHNRNFYYTARTSPKDGKPAHMKKTVLVVLAAVAIAAVGSGGYWAGSRQHPVPPPATASGKGGGGGGGTGGGGGQPVQVEATRVAVMPLPQVLAAVGSLRSDESVMVRPEVAGRVSAILFKEGERVAKGTPLVRLDTAINDADVRQARANLTLARSKHERALDLQKRGFISAQARDEAENNLRVAEASLALAEAKFAKTEIKAPFTGVIGLRSVSVGDYVKEGADIVNLEAIDPLKVDFRIPEVFFAQVRVGQKLDVALDAFPGKIFAGNVYAVNPLVDAGGRSVVVRAVVRNPDTLLRPGMFARVRLITRDVKDAMVVPEQALVPQGEDQYVFRVVDDRALRVRIQVGQRGGGRAEVVNGLAVGDVIVTAGQLKIRDGSSVKLVRVSEMATDAASGATAASPKGVDPADGKAGGKANPRTPSAPAKADDKPAQARS